MSGTDDDGIPDDDDNVIFPSGTSAVNTTISANATCRSFVISSGSSGMRIVSLVSGVKLTVKGFAGDALVVSSSTSGTGDRILDVADGILEIEQGNVLINGGTSGRDSILRVQNGRISVLNGGISFTTSLARLEITAASGVVELAGNLGSGGSLTPLDGTLRFNGMAAQSFPALVADTLEIQNAAGVSPSGNISVKRIRISNSGRFEETAGRTVTPSGTSLLEITSGAYLCKNASLPSFASTQLSGGTVIFSSAAAQTIPALSYGSLAVQGNRDTNTVIFAAGVIGIAGQLDISSATFSTGMYQTTGTTFHYNSGAQTIAATTPQFAYQNVMLTVGAGTAFALNANATINGVLNISDPAVVLTISNGAAIDLGSAGTLNEIVSGDTRNENTQGEIRATRTVGDGSSEFSDLGVTITDKPSAGNPGTVTVRRFSRTSPTGLTDAVQRLWSFENGGAPVDAELSLGFFSTEAVGVSSAALNAYRSPDGGTWLPLATSTRGNPTTADTTVLGFFALAEVPSNALSIETAADGTGTLLGAATLTAGSAVTAYAILRDGQGSFLANVPATWSLQGKTGGVLDADLLVAGDGRSAQFSARRAGTAKIQAESADPFTAQSGTLSVIPAPATQLVFLTPARAIVAGQVSDIVTIQRCDAFGNPNSTDADLTLSLMSSNAVTGVFRNAAGVSSIVSITLANGTDSASFRYTDTLASQASLTVDDAGELVPVSQTITVNAGPATTLRVSGIADPIVSGTNASVKVEALDSFNNAATDYSGTVQFTSSDAQATLPGDYTFVPADAGLHLFPVVLRAVGEHSVTASDTVAATLSSTQEDITVQPGAVLTLTAQTSPARLDQAVEIKAEVRDASNALISGATITFDFLGDPLGAMLTHLFTETVEGIATETLTPGAQTGTVTVQVSVTHNGATVTGSVPVEFTRAAVALSLSSSSAGSSIYGDEVSFVATLADSTYSVPTGTVRFYADGMQQDVAVSGTGAQWEIATLAAGAHVIQAEYLGDARFLPSSLVTLVGGHAVGFAPLTVTANNHSRAYGAANPALTFRFSGFKNGEDETVVTGAPILATSAGPSSTVGDYPISVDLSAAGAANYTLVAQNGTLTVTAAATTLAVDSVSVTYNDAAQTVALRADVSSVAGIVNDGEVAFEITIGATTYAPVAAVSGGVAAADFVLAAGAAAGSYSIAAEFKNSTNFLDCAAPVANFDIARSATTIAVSTHVNPSVFGQSVRVSATVFGNGQPTGSVDFRVDGGVPIGVELVNGVAALDLTTLSVATHTVSARYLGSANFSASAETVLPGGQSVGKAATAITLTGNAATVNLGSPAQFTATIAVLAPGAGTPTGSVRFLDGATVLGTSNIEAGGQAAFSFSTLAAGAHSIKAEYDGDGSFQPCVSAFFGITVLAPPSISTVSPAIGATAGGTLIAVEGAHFGSGATLFVGGLAATDVTVVSDSRITARTPAHAAGSVTVTVTNPSTLTVSLPGAFTYNDPPQSGSGLVFFPALPVSGETVVVSAGAADPEGAALSYSIAWGDGNSGPTLTHAYDVPGLYDVVVTVSDGNYAITLSQTLQVFAPAIPNEPLTVLTKKISARNPSAGKDSAQITGTLQLPAGVTRLDGELCLRFGGISKTFGLAKGKGKSGGSTFALSGKSKKGILVSPSVKFQARVVDNLLSEITAAGLAPGASGQIAMNLEFDFAGKTYQSIVPFAVTGKPKSINGK